MPSGWIRRNDGSMGPGDDSNSLKDIEFKPEKLKQELTETFETHITALVESQKEALKPMNDFMATIMQEREERRQAAQRALEAKNKQDGEVTTEDYILDPTGAVKKQLESYINPLVKTQQMITARMAAKEVLGDREYYHGDLKAKIDNMIASGTLEQQSNPQFLDNCYKLSVYDAQQDIAAGKIKARNNVASFESTGTGAHGGRSEESSETLSGEEKLIAQKMGFSEKDWISSRKELTYV